MISWGRHGCKASGGDRTGAGRARNAFRAARSSPISRASGIPLDLAARRHRLLPHDGPQPRTARGPRRPLYHLDAGNPAPRNVRGRHTEVRPPPCGRQTDRVGVHSGHAGADILHLDPGRVRHGLRVLPHRQDGLDPSPVRRRDRRASARARPRPRPVRGAVQYRPDGHGRTAAQLRRDDEGAPHRLRRARPVGQPAPGDVVHGRPRADARQARRRGADAEPGDLSARDH